MMNSRSVEAETGRILVIDDDIHVGATTVKIIESQDHGVRYFDNGSDALAYFRKDCCDLVLSDVKMPGMDGVELLGQIRQRDHQWGSVVAYFLLSLPPKPPGLPRLPTSCSRIVVSWP